MSMKKIVSAAMALAMTASLAVPAFASTTPNTTTDVTGTTQAPTIAVTVPATGTVTVNPYKMEVTVGSDKLTDQIISTTSYVQNESDVPLVVDVTVTGKVAGNAVFATASTQGAKAPTTNSVFMYAEFGVATANDGTGDPSWGTAYDSKSTSQVLLSAKATTKKAVATLPAGDSTTNYLAFKLAGDAASAPTTAWASTDTVGATVAYTFTATAAASGT